MNIRGILSLTKYLRRERLSPLLFLFLLAPFHSSLSQNIQHTWEGVERIVAVGDVHGDYESFIKTLEEAGVTNGSGKWKAGNTHLVQMGDIPGYGADTTKIMRYLMKLEQQALKAGGRVHVLIGDHEAMNITGDLRFVPDEEFEILKSRKSKKIRDEYFHEAYAEANYVSSSSVTTILDELFRSNWYARTPLGYVEHRLLWALDGEFGEWVMSHNAMIKINNILFSHAGLGPNITGDLGALNNRIRSELAGDAYIDEQQLHTHERGPLKYHGHTQRAALLEEINVDSILANFGVDHLVVGHTAGLGIVYPRFNGKIINIDSGISEYFGGYRTSLEITNDTILINMGKDVQLLLLDTPEAEEAYLKAALALTLDPPEALLELIDSFE